MIIDTDENHVYFKQEMDYNGNLLNVNSEKF